MRDQRAWRHGADPRVAADPEGWFDQLVILSTLNPVWT